MPFVGIGVTIGGQTLTSEDVTYLLDDYPGAAAAYSLRQLSSTYSGDSIRVRRASDNAESDIGFVSGQLDTSTLETFCSGTDGFVTTWYDQSGNNRDVVQSTAANQPQIVSSGSAITDNTKNAIDFDGVNDGFKESLTSNSVTPYVVISVQNSDKTSGTQSIVRIGATKPTIHRFDNSNYRIYSGDPAGSFDSQTNCAVSTQLLLESYFTSTTVNQYVNSASGNNDTGVNASITGAIEIGATTGFSEYFDGKIQELIIYGSDQSSNRTNIETNINSQYNIYWDGSQTSLLDSYGGSAAAYSLRALSSSYTGALIKVRRASDNAEQDIYAKYDGTLNTDALESFCSGTNGYVTTWYDQSGNGNDATQSTSANQPKIVSSGSTITENGKPALNYDGTNHYLSASNVSSFDNQLEVSIISINKYTRDVNVVYATNMNGYTNSTNAHQLFYRFDGDIYFLGRNQSGVAQSVISANNSLNNQYLQFSAINSSSSISLSVNGNNIIQTNLDIATPTTNNSIGIGGNGTATNLFEGTLQEIVLYPSDQSTNRANIESNINNHYNIY